MHFNALKIAIIALTFIPALASAHSGHEHTSSLFAGFTHPLIGLDHVLAMLAVGLWGANLGGRASWAVPAAFIATMMFGGLLVVTGFEIPFIEQGIALSVLLVGALLVSSIKLSAVVSAIIAGLFAIFHGAAHGVELPQHAHALEYGLGFSIATLLLHLIGFGTGTLIKRVKAPFIAQFIGSIIALAGVFLVIN